MLQSLIYGGTSDSFAICAVVSRDGTTIASNSLTNNIRIYRYINSELVQIGNIPQGNTGYPQSISLSQNGNRIAIGYPGSNSTATGNFMDGSFKFYYNGSTEVYDFSPANKNWNKFGSSILGVANSGERLGWSVSLSSDGNTVAIGSPENNYYTGLTRIYISVSGNWEQKGEIIFGSSQNEYSGTSVSLSSDGNTVAIGAMGHYSSRGVTRVYRYSGVWSNIGSIEGDTVNEYSGYSVSLSSDGNTVAIGAYFNSNINGIAAGVARVYRYSGSGTTWTKIGQNISGENTSEQSGGSVSLSSNATTIAVGGRNHNEYTGMVRIYRLVGSVWEKISIIPGVNIGEQSGRSVSISGEGDIVAVGAPNFSLSGVTHGVLRVYKNVAASVPNNVYDLAFIMRIS